MEKRLGERVEVDKRVQRLRIITARGKIRYQRADGNEGHYARKDLMLEKTYERSVGGGR